MTQLLSCIKGLKNKSSGFQSLTFFYKLSNTDIDFIKNQINIDINNDMIVKKVFRQTRDVPTNRLGGKKAQYDREKEALLLLQKDEHFPTILCYDDRNHTIYMNSCGDKIRKRTRLPHNWKEQMSEIFSTLEKYKIYWNDFYPTNILLNENILYAVDFGWSTLEKEGYPFYNVTQDEIENCRDMFQLLNTIKKKYKDIRKEFEKKIKIE